VAPPKRAVTPLIRVGGDTRGAGILIFEDRAIIEWKNEDFQRGRLAIDLHGKPTLITCGLYVLNGG
jgi:hypothetical protein